MQPLRSRPHPALFLAFFLGCASTPPAESPSAEKRDTVQKFCEVDALAGLAAADDPLGIGARRTEWLTAHVDTPDGIYLRTLLSVQGAEEQARMLRSEARESGLARCAFADSLEAEKAGGLSP